jgi:hypothetical protein
MIMSFEGHQQALESEKQKELEVKSIQSQLNRIQSILEILITGLSKTSNQDQVNIMADHCFHLVL